MSFYSKILIQCKEFNVRVLVAGQVHEYDHDDRVGAISGVM